jgi:hypothetical protein
VLTVGATTTNGTPGRDDDTMARFSSRGPTYLDWAAKPDLAAPGVGTVSLADPASRYYTSKATHLIGGPHATAYAPYLSLTGTSMAAPVVSGTIALMLEANPRLTPNAIKAILQYTAFRQANYDALTQGAGFLNSLGAVQFSQTWDDIHVGDAHSADPAWSRQIIWGNRRVSGWRLLPWANAWSRATVWGVEKSASGEHIGWGTTCRRECDDIVRPADDRDNIVWGTGSRDNIVWGTDHRDNIVWGTSCGGEDCDNVVWGSDGESGNTVWGADGRGNSVWSSGFEDEILWRDDGLSAADVAVR